MSDSPLFSVIIPTYNRSHLLRRSIESVLQQDLDDFELVIADDNSTDDTEDVVGSFGDERIVYVKRTENGSASAARNTGIRKAKGKYVSLLDDDDEYEIDFLSKTYEAFQHAPDYVKWSWAGIRRVQDAPEEGPEVVGSAQIWRLPDFSSTEEGYLYMLRRVGVATSYGITIRRELFDEMGLFDEAFTAQEDADFTIRAAQHARYMAVPHALVRVHSHPGPNLTKQLQRAAADYEKLLGKLMPVLKTNQNLWCQYHYKVGHMWYASGHRKKGRQYITKALKPLSSPHARKAWFAFAMYELFGTAWGQIMHQEISRWMIRMRKRLPGYRLR